MQQKTCINIERLQTSLDVMQVYMRVFGCLVHVYGQQQVQMPMWQHITSLILFASFSCHILCVLHFVLSVWYVGSYLCLLYDFWVSYKSHMFYILSMFVICCVTHVSYVLCLGCICVLCFLSILRDMNQRSYERWNKRGVAQNLEPSKLTKYLDFESPFRLVIQ